MVGQSATVEAVVDVVAETATEIRQGLVGRRGAVDAENPSGETQVEADVWADGLLERRLSAIDGVGQYASEERSEVVDCGGVTAEDDTVAVAVDPLDGSSNLRSNNAMGTVFGVYDVPLPGTADRPPRGTDLLAAGYVLYGPITTILVARDGPPVEYECTASERTTIDEAVAIPDEPTVYGFGGRVPDWPAAFEAYAREVETELKLRYGGAMIADVNQVLTHGGIFAYPGLTSRPEGKLRLLFEGHPIAHLVEAAGGRSSNGHRSLLDVGAETLHQRTPVHVGTPGLIDRLEDALA